MVLRCFPSQEWPFVVTRSIRSGNKSPVAVEALERIGALDAVESDINADDRQKNAAGSATGAAGRCSNH
jgi:hypothetical protein